MSQKKNSQIRKKELIKALQETADILGKHPGTVTPSEVLNNVDYITNWDIRVLGNTAGFNSIKNAHYPLTDKDLESIRSNQRTSQYISKLEREVGDKLAFQKAVLKIIDKSMSQLSGGKVKFKRWKPIKSRKKMTMELMLSDIHYGKKTGTFDLKTCRKRMRQLTNTFLDELDQKQKSFNVEHIVLALIGDLIESFSMHGLESAVGCEFGNARQMQEAIDSLFDDVIVPIAKRGIRITVPAVTGNHDRTETKMTMNEPGMNNMTWVIYKALEKMCKIKGLTTVKFIIPKDGFTTLDIYGSTVLYEHGDNLRNVQKGTILNHMAARGRQIKKQIVMARFGHWHEYVCFDRGRAIVNESVCGQDSFAKVKGFDSTAGQTINFYVETKNRPTSFYYSFPIYLG